MKPVADEAAELLGVFGIQNSGGLASISPIDGSEIGRVETGDPELAATAADKAFLDWRSVPAPRRGELVRLLGEELRAAKEPLARLVTLEAGKSYTSRISFVLHEV
jgi:aldehyde dehydrogenase (NAD+)